MEHVWGRAFLLVTVVLLAARFAGAERLPEPTPAQQEKADRYVRELYAPYPPSKVADRQAVALKMIELARNTKDDAPARFVLLKNARDLSAGAGDFTLALTAADELSAVFQVDPFDARQDAMKQACAVADDAASRPLAEMCLKLAEDAVDAEQYRVAVRFATLAETVAQKTRDIPFAASVRVSGEDIQRVLSESNRAQAAIQKLAQKPDDAEANAIAGRFACFIQDQWDFGLPLLSRSGDAKLKEIATKDLAKPATAEQRIALAEEWSAMADKVPGCFRRGALRRAAHWCAEALPLTTGLTRGVVEKRLKELRPDPAIVPSAPTTRPAASTTRPVDDTTVYVTKGGQKYHRQNCPALNKVGIPKSLSEAKAEGFTPCARCRPPQ